MKRAYYFLFLISFLKISANDYDLTLIGSIGLESICKLPVLWMDNLSKDLNINFIPIWQSNLTSASDVVKRINSIPFSAAGKVSVLMENIWSHDMNPAGAVPESLIKIAYSFFEGTKLPPKWIEILNTQFDAVIVADDFWVNVYKNSGVNIPIYVLPMALDLDDLLLNQKKEANTQFTFGTSAAFWTRKNQFFLLKAFHEQFGNSDKFKLVIHGRGGELSVLYELENYIKDNNISNVIIECKRTDSEEFKNFMKSLDCYVLISKSEGYSISPREAMALGIPCILSCNTAHITLCNSGLVRSVLCPKSEKANYGNAFGENVDCGEIFNCEIPDIRAALRDVYDNYKLYLEKAKKGKSWVERYNFSNLKQKHLNLIKPKQVIFGLENKIEDNYIMTNSVKLYNKYKSLKN